ncbi:hypothetical protein B5F79_03555 [Olsenella sp. An285]|uniref:hypothetical protein n=1 Tax=Olsenella sp. An285 TaxID=1965621 RepID=UPI000B3653EA|nr:hypothetical protein [Olsenella sp. An285]OUO47896.1 hypothetical protein B5F79_03555 [Olsenella sp. An285]
MNIRRCAYGHFYDGDEHGDACPFCAQVKGAQAEKNPEASADDGAQAEGRRETERVAAAEAEPESSPAAKVEPEPSPAAEPTPAADPEPEPTVELEPEPEPASFSPSPAAAPAPAPEPNGAPLDPDLVVGWLVCVSGPARGRSYELHAGRNFIGRAAIMDVALPEDAAVARERQASVIFDPRTARFSVTANETHELTYVNDELVYDHCDLTANDVLLVGSTRLMLVPLCGSGFAWAEWPA